MQRRGRASSRLKGWWHTGRWAPLPAQGVATAQPTADEAADDAQPPAIEVPEVEPQVRAEPAPEPRPARALTSELEGQLVAVLDDLGSAHHRPFSRG